MRIFLTRDFARFARKSGLPPGSLREAANRVVTGQPDASLGHGIFKQRVARRGGGKSGGFRTILVFKTGRSCFFVHGFAKNDKANVSPSELKALKTLALVLLRFDAEQLLTAAESGELIEVNDDDSVQDV